MWVIRSIPIVLIIALVLGLSSHQSFAACNVCGDFNNDGFDDIVIGVPFENLSGTSEGAVNVIYGSAAGLHRSLGHNDQFWTQDSPGIADSAENGDRFGLFLVIGDFNGDTFDDLAIGVKLEDFTGTNAEGAVNVIYGSAFGLHKSVGHNDQLWGQDSKGIADSAETSDNFGQTLTVGDFNGDTFDDLVVGVPFEDFTGTDNEGAVNVIYGSAFGLHRSVGHNDQLWSQDSGGIADSAEIGDLFGTTLTVGDFNGDTFDDLVIGVERENLSGSDEGAVNVIYGSAAGLHRSLGHNDQFWTQDSKGIADTAQDFDQFGRALAAGDFNNDGFDDLAIGVPFEDFTGTNNEGAVHVIYGSAAGLHRSLGHNDQLWSQDSGGIADSAEIGDNFGRTLTVGDFNGDTFDDLAIGVPGENLSGNSEGAVNVIYGSAFGLHRSAGHNDQFWHQDSKGIADSPQDFDNFGSLSAGDFNNDGFDDLAIGVPGEDLSFFEQGAMNVIYGSAAGLHRSLGHNDQLWSQDSGGIADTGEAFDCFGLTLPGSIIFCGD